MSVIEPFYIKVLRQDFESKKKRNPSFSFRSYAKFLGIEASSLLSVIKGNRKIPKSKINQIVAKISMSPKQKKMFLQSHSPELVFIDLDVTIENKKLTDEAYFAVIAEWEHYAILSLIETKNFSSSIKWIADRLGISVNRAQLCINNLISCGLIKLENKKIQLSQSSVTTNEDVMSAALRKSTIEDIEQSLNKIEEVDLLLRDFSSATMTVNTKDIPEIKKMIREFRKKLISYAEFEEGEEVYKINVQFFPITKIKKNKEVENEK